MQFSARKSYCWIHCGIWFYGHETRIVYALDEQRRRVLAKLRSKRICLHLLSHCELECLRFLNRWESIQCASKAEGSNKACWYQWLVQRYIDHRVYRVYWQTLDNLGVVRYHRCTYSGDIVVEMAAVHAMSQCNLANKLDEWDWEIHRRGMSKVLGVKYLIGYFCRSHCCNLTRIHQRNVNQSHRACYTCGWIRSGELERIGAR